MMPKCTEIIHKKTNNHLKKCICKFKLVKLSSNSQFIIFPWKQVVKNNTKYPRSEQKSALNLPVCVAKQTGAALSGSGRNSCKKSTKQNTKLRYFQGVHTHKHTEYQLFPPSCLLCLVSLDCDDLKQLTSSSNLKLRRVGKLRTGLQLGQQFVCICTREAEHVAKHVYEPELQLWWSVKRSWVQFFLTLWFQVEICFKFIPYAKQRKGWTSQLKGCWFLNLENFKKK